MTETADWPQEPAERVRELVEGVLDELDLDGEVEIEEDDDRIAVTVEGEDDYGLLIGKRGQTIDALQLLCYQAAFRGLRERKRVVVDAAGYRERRRETLEGRADRAAEQALSSNHVVEMDPMSAQERRVVHERLKERAGVETYSEGDEPNRCVDRRSARRGVSAGPHRGARARPAARRWARSSSCSPQERASVSSVVDERAWKVHVADSLTGLEVAELRERRADRRRRCRSRLPRPGPGRRPARTPRST